MAAPPPVSATSTENEEYLYRISTGEEWDSLQTNGSTLGGELDKTTGCIHLSKLKQVQCVLLKFFVGKEQQDLYLLQIDAKRLGEGLVYEAVVDEEEEEKVFPHLYGPLTLEVVTEAQKLIPEDADAKGKFTCSFFETLTK